MQRNIDHHSTTLAPQAARFDGDGFLPMAPRARQWGSFSRSRERAKPALPTRVPIADIWADLLGGRCMISSDLTTSTYCYLTLRSRAPNPSHQISKHQAHVLEALFSGVPLKTVAIDLDRAASTVSMMAQRGLHELGVSPLPRSRAPLLLAIIGNAHATNPALTVSARTSRDDGVLHSVISFPRPDPVLEPYLSPAEYDIVRLTLEGGSHHDIANARGRSPRTIANQLSSTFRKLGVSGRFQLLGLALRAARCEPLESSPASSIGRENRTVGRPVV